MEMRLWLFPVRGEAEHIEAVHLCNMISFSFSNVVWNKELEARWLLPFEVSRFFFFFFDKLVCLFACLFYIPGTVSPPSLPLSPSLPYPLCPAQSIPSPFLFRKGQASLEYQESMAYQVSVRLSTSPCI